MTNRKAQGISINIVVILVIALMALLLVGGFVTGWFSRAGGGVQAVGGDVINTTHELGIGDKLKGITSTWGCNDDSECPADKTCKIKEGADTGRCVDPNEI